MFDMGPYYLTALVALLGPVKRVSGAHGRAFDRRLITSEPLSGTTIDVEVSTHVCRDTRLRERCDRNDSHQLRRVGLRDSLDGDLWHRRHSKRARPQHVQRSGFDFSAGVESGRRVPNGTPRRWPRDRSGGYGGRVEERTPVTGRRRDGLSRPRHHARRPRVVRRRSPRHVANYLRPADGCAARTSTGLFRSRRLIGPVIRSADRIFRRSEQFSLERLDPTALVMRQPVDPDVQVDGDVEWLHGCCWDVR